MPEWYMTPHGTKLPHHLVTDLRSVALFAKMKVSDDWLFQQVRTLNIVSDPTKYFIAYPERDGVWKGWLIPCHDGQGIAYDFDENGDPVSWGSPIKRTGESANEGAREWIEATQHIAAAWTLWRSMNAAVCENCKGNKNYAELSGFWADTGKESAHLTSSPFRRSQLHYDCPVCGKYRESGKGSKMDYGTQSYASYTDRDIDLDTH